MIPLHKFFGFVHKVFVISQILAIFPPNLGQFCT